jgi:class 3 adenylate cyclase/tetratricopeptide (TPR) repeat protein
MLAIDSPLCSFAPRFLLRRLAGAADPSGEVALLLVDVAGFTPLTERLAAAGPRGVERLTRLLSDWFGAIIDRISAHGGDVVCFAGDALIAMWPVGDGDAADVITRVAACGLDLLRGHHPYTLEDASLSLHAAVAVGLAAVAECGGRRGRREVVVVGPAFAALGPALKASGPGELVLDAACADRVGERVIGARRPDGSLRAERVVRPPPVRSLDDVDIDDDARRRLRAYVPQAILGRLDAGLGDWMAELRTVTVLFVAFPDLADGDAAAVRRLGLAMDAVQAEVYRYAGSIDKLLVDDKGASIVAAFGLPPLTHEDDPVRGALAGAAIHRALLDLGVAARVGVATGRVFAGPVGSPTRRQYTVLGPAVNRAARLSALADGVLTDDATWQAARTRVLFTELPPVTLKGIPEPVAVYRPSRERRLPDAEADGSPMIGREPLLAALTARLDALTTGDGGGVLLVGEPGIGKSRVLRQVAADARIRGFRTYWGGGDPVLASVPWHLWSGVVEGLLADGGGEVAWPPERPADLALLADVVDLSTEATSPLVGEARADAIRRLLLEWLRDAAEAAGPHRLVLLLEDLHAADGASLELLRDVVARNLPILLVATRRPLDPRDPDDAWASGLERHVLDALDAEDAARLVASLMPSLDPRLSARVAAAGDGNPLFLEELAASLGDVVEETSGRLRIASDRPDQLPLPATLDGLLTSRTDRLDPTSQWILKAASVIGVGFDAGVLASLIPQHRTDLERHLDGLVAEGLLIRTAPDKWRFRHALTREVTHEHLLFEHRRTLHGALADGYEATDDSSAPGWHARLAYHREEAGQLGAAVEHYAAAARQAVERGAHHAAISSLESTLRVADALPARPDPVLRARWLVDLGTARNAVGRRDEARRALDEALSLLGAPVPQSRPGMMQAALWELGRQVLRRGLPSRTPSPSPKDAGRILAAKAYEQLGYVYYAANDTVSGVHAALRMLNLAEAASPSPELARAYINTALAATIVGRPGISRFFEGRAAWADERQSDPATSGHVAWVSGMLAATRGEWATAATLGDAALQIASKLGDRDMAFATHAWLAAAGGLRQDAAAVARSTAAIRSLADRIERPHWHGFAAAYDAAVAVRRGSSDGLIADLRAAVDEGRSAADHGLLLQSWGLLALALHNDGQVAAALEEALAALKAGDGAPITAINLFDGYAGVAEVLLEAWAAGAAEAERPAARAVSELGRFAAVFSVAKPRAAVLRARLARLSGKPKEIRRHADEASKLGSELGLPFDVALADLERSRDPSATPADRSARADAAAAALAALGCGP